MRFSFLVPVYNAAGYIDECVESMLSQTVDDYEIILLDDGSSDSSYAICCGYAAKDSRIKAFSQSNAGPFIARRKCAELASGDYFIFVDSDDFVAHDLLQKLSCVVDSFSPDVILHETYIYADGKTSACSSDLFEESRLLSKNEVCSDILRRRIPNGIVAKAIKKELFDFSEDCSGSTGLIMGEDLLQFLPLITKAEKVYYLKEKLYYYRTTSGSLSRSFDPRHVQSLLTLNAELRKYASEWNIPGGEALAAGRFLYDIYDIIRYSSNSRSNKVIMDTFDLLCSGDSHAFYKEQYALADRSVLDFKSEVVSFFLYHKLKLLTLLYVYVVIYGGNFIRNTCLSLIDRLSKRPPSAAD